MDFDLTDRQKHWQGRVREFIERKVRPAVPTYKEQDAAGDRWKVIQIVEDLKAEAKAAGIWNLFMPPRSDAHHHVDETFEFEGPGLTNLEYALCAEEMGRVGFASEVFNCSAPDTGNMEVFHRYGTAAQKEKWLKPLMNGEIRSAFLMTEPQVASSDATNIETRIERDGDDYVINGTKWWSSGAGDPRCKVAIVMGKTDFGAKRHQQQSMLAVPMDAPGINILRHLPVFGYDDAPHGHMEIELKDVRVNAEEAMLLGEGRGFEIAQGRLGPGRIHHCMRSIGQAQRALEHMARRADSRVAFGKKLADQSSIRQDVARSFCEVEMARLLTLKAADAMDRYGNKKAKDLIAAIKVIAPTMAQTVADRAIQVHGGMGVSDDTPVAGFFTLNRYVRITDGPEEVHMSQLGKQKIAEYAAMNAR